ncbi:MAG: hypothetical protein ACK58L_21620, partial [Planctomycetota bacterium]
MRQRAEEALSASVHHASLSQQYLTLSQKFAGLAEQATHGAPWSLAKSAAQLVREATTGVPANPIGLPQVAISLPPSQSDSTSAATPISGPHFACDVSAVSAKESTIVRTQVGIDAGSSVSLDTPPEVHNSLPGAEDPGVPMFHPSPAMESA